MKSMLNLQSNKSTMKKLSITSPKKNTKFLSIIIDDTDQSTNSISIMNRNNSIIIMNHHVDHLNGSRKTDLIYTGNDINVPEQFSKYIPFIQINKA